MTVAMFKCAYCGAPMQVHANTGRVDCAYCGAQGERKGETQPDGRIADELEAIRLRSELFNLERDWARVRESYLVCDTIGRRFEPSVEAQSCASGFLVVFAAVLGMIFMFSSVPLLIVFLLVVAAVWVKMYLNLERAKDFESQRDTYTRRRERLLHRLQELV